MKAQNSKLKADAPAPLWSFIAIVVVTILTFAAYFPAQKNKFTNWDDDRYIVENKDITSLKKENLSALLSKNYEGNYHPLTMISYALNYQSGKLNPKIYIQTNIWLHVLSTVLVFILIQGLFQKTIVSFFTSLLFGIHPIHVESVAWISERKDVLYCFFFVSSLITYLYYCKKQNLLLYVAALALFMLSLFSKGMAVTLAVSVFLIDYLTQRKLLSIKVLLEKIPFLLLAVWFGRLAIKAQEVQDIEKVDSPFSFTERIAVAGNGFSEYIAKQLFPYKLSAFYPYPEKIPLYFWIMTGISAFAVILVSIYWIRNQSRNPYSKIYLAGLWFFIFNIGPVLQLLPVGKAMMADRYTYVASIGFFWVIGFTLYQISKKVPGKEWLLSFPLGGYFLFLFLNTQTQCKVWNNSISLWDHVIKHYPEADIAYLNRGLEKHRRGEKEAAIRDYKKAVELDPEMYLAWNNLGSIHSELGKHEEALPYFSKSIQLNPKFANTWMNRAKTRSVLKDYEGAIKDYDQYLRLIPNNPDILNDRGLAYYHLSRLEEAKKDYDLAIEAGMQVKSSNLGIYYLNRGLCRAFLKDYKGAFEDYDKSLLTHPSPGAVYYNRGILHCFVGDFKKGCEDLKLAERSGMKQATEKLNSYCSR